MATSLTLNRLYYHNLPLQRLNLVNSPHSKTAGRYILLNLAEAAGFVLAASITLGLFFTSIQALLDTLRDSNGERFKKIIKDRPIKILKTATVALASHLIGMIPLIGQIFAYSVAKKADTKVFDDPVETKEGLKRTHPRQDINQLLRAAFRQKLIAKGYIWDPLQIKNNDCIEPGFISNICMPIKGIITVAQKLNRLFQIPINRLVSILTLC